MLALLGRSVRGLWATLLLGLALVGGCSEGRGALELDVTVIEGPTPAFLDLAIGAANAREFGQGHRFTWPAARSAALGLDRLPSSLEGDRVLLLLTRDAMGCLTGCGRVATTLVSGRLRKLPVVMSTAARSVCDTSATLDESLCPWLGSTADAGLESVLRDGASPDVADASARDAGDAGDAGARDAGDASSRDAGDADVRDAGDASPRDAASADLPPDAPAKDGGTDGNGDGTSLPPARDAAADKQTAGPPVSPRGSRFCDERYLYLGEYRAFINEWTDPTADTCVFLEQDGRFGWTWSRGGTGSGGNPTYPNTPEVELGMDPWNSNGTQQSTTSLLPIKLGDITSAHADIDVKTDVGTNNSGWNLLLQIALADKNPALGPATPRGLIAILLSNAPDFAPTSPEANTNSQTLDDGARIYKLYVSSETWGDWGSYREYRVDTHNGAFKGRVNLDAFIRHLIVDEGWSSSLWVSRFEVGNSVFQNSAGTTTFFSLSFEVNGINKVATTQ